MAVEKSPVPDSFSYFDRFPHIWTSWNIKNPSLVFKQTLKYIFIRGKKQMNHNIMKDTSVKTDI